MDELFQLLLSGKAKQISMVPGHIDGWVQFWIKDEFGMTLTVDINTKKDQDIGRAVCAEFQAATEEKRP